MNMRISVVYLFRCTDGIIFVVDSSDEERVEEARLELLKIAKLTERYAVPILVLANKQVKNKKSVYFIIFRYISIYF